MFLLIVKKIFGKRDYFLNNFNGFKIISKKLAVRFGRNEKKKLEDDEFWKNVIEIEGHF